MPGRMNSQLKKQLMTKEELLIEFSEILKEDDLLKASGIYEENFRPHQFTDGIMTEEICQMYPCGVKKCKLSYQSHDSDKQLVLQLKKNITHDETREQLLKINSKIQELGIKTVAFADSDEGYAFIKPKKRFL